MSFSVTPCCVVLNQQQQQNIDHCNQSCDEDAATPAKAKPKKCTVVENGRVVVKPITTEQE